MEQKDFDNDPHVNLMKEFFEKFDVSYNTVKNKKNTINLIIKSKQKSPEGNGFWGMRAIEKTKVG